MGRGLSGNFSLSSVCASETEMPSRTSRTAWRRFSGVIRFNVPRWSSLPQRPQFEISVIHFSTCSRVTRVGVCALTANTTQASAAIRINIFGFIGEPAHFLLTSSGRRAPDLTARIEEIEDRGHVRAGDVYVTSTGHLDILHVDVEPVHFGNHRSRSIYRHDVVGVAVHDDLRDLPHGLDCRGITEPGNGSQRGPDFSVLRAQRPGADPAHGVAHQVNAVFIDLVLPADALEHLHDILGTPFGVAAGSAGTGKPVKAVNPTAERRDPDLTVLFGRR